MLIMIIAVDAPEGSAQGAKESIAMAMEHLDPVRVVEIREIPPEQQKIKM